MKLSARIMPFLVLLMLACVGSGLVYAQATSPGTVKMIQLPSGEEVFDVSGEWDVIVQNYGELERYGSYSQVFKITQKGSSFTGIRLKDNPPPSTGRAGSECVQGELDKGGFKGIDLITGGGEVLPSRWQLSEGGNKIDLDAP